MVTGTTASSGDHSIITGRRVSPVASWTRLAKNSVWPGSAKPDLYRTFLATGLVTIAAALPAKTSPTARRIDAIAAGALEPSGRPGSAVTAMSRPTTGNAEANAWIAEEGVTVATGASSLSAAARRRRNFSSATM